MKIVNDEKTDMNKIIGLTSIALILTAGLGITKGVNSTTNTLLADESHGGMSHSHKKMEIPAGKPIPEVELIVHPDAMKGWNLEVKLTNFQLAPETLNQTSNPNEGHAHLYINGEKITRIYGDWYYLEKLEPGSNKVTITLNTNKHEDLVKDGEMIMDTEIINQE
ncbi:MAG: hypothetical protein QNJ68_17140 [Microcoleaceae cyanobacterium MO_207.B10]|nr:hypothetical protein [Microcoleaceae cyanobacterium MO_207.B10]